MNFTTAVRTCFRKYLNARGRASRSEFWYFLLFYALFGIFLIVSLAIVALSVDEAILDHWIVSYAIQFLVFAALVPGIMCMIRRLHDMNFSGWWIVVTWVPVVGQFAWLVLLGICLFRGTIGENRFGPDPLLDPKITSREDLGEIFA